MSVVSEIKAIEKELEQKKKQRIHLVDSLQVFDIGGYATKNGMHVKWGKIYRSDDLNRLSDKDLKKLQDLDIGFVADFRGPFEAKAAPDRLPAGAVRISLPAGSEHIGDSSNKTMGLQLPPDSSLVVFYRNTAPFRERYKPVFDALLGLPAGNALLYHCTAGKDRTGIATALILYALGVDKTVIVQDYIATNVYRRSANAKAIPAMVKGYGISEKVATNMMAARQEYIEATFSSLEEQYGSIDNYLEKEMGLNKAKRKQLQALYLTE